MNFFTDGEFKEVFAIDLKQDKEKAQGIRAVFPSILTKYCIGFAAKTALSSNLRRLAIGVLSERVLEIQIFDIISSKYSEICSIFPAFFPHSIIKFIISKIL